MSDLPVNIDTTYEDDGGDASVKAHQEHHDALHALYNAIAGAAPDPTTVGLANNTPRRIFETALGVWTADAPAGRSDYEDTIEFVGVTDPTDVTNGITTPANIVAGDRWTETTSFVS